MAIRHVYIWAISGKGSIKSSGRIVMMSVPRNLGTTRNRSSGCSVEKLRSFIMWRSGFLERVRRARRRQRRGWGRRIMVLGEQFEMVRRLLFLCIFLSFLKARELGARSYFFVICVRNLFSHQQDNATVMAKKCMYVCIKRQCGQYTDR